MLITCPKCESTVSETDLDCPYCGVAISRVTNNNGIFGRIYQAFAGWQKRNQLCSEQMLLEAKNMSKTAPVLGPSYKAYPYLDGSCAVDHAKFHHDLVMNSFNPSTFDVFDDPAVGYKLNRQWMLAWLRNRSGGWASFLFTANHFNDKDAFKIFGERGKQKIANEAGALFRSHYGPWMTKLDEDFFDKYIPLDKESVRGYMKEMHWLSSIEEGKFARIDFMRSKGYEVRIGDDGLTTIRHSDFSLWYSYEMESPLSRALDKDDLDRLSFLLKWGANPNQYLYWSCGRKKNSTPIHEDPVMTRIRSVAAFKMMTDAGMEWYPCPNPSRSASLCNLVDCLWLGEYITGSRLELLNYLYEIGYDRPLRGKQDYYRGIVSKRGTSYEKNVDHIRRWLKMQK